MPGATIVRIQRRRAKGWRMPPGAIYVGRPSRWGNPFVVGKIVQRGLSFSGRDELIRDAEHAVRLYRRWLATQGRSANLIPLLAGHDLACWCPLDQPCHADVLLELANAEAERPPGIPLSELSGRPGHEGYERFKAIAASWGYE